MNGDSAGQPMHIQVPTHRARLKRRRQENFSESKQSAFARLSPGLVSLLYQDALDQAHARLGEGEDFQLGWNVLSTSESDRIEFLPLAIALDSNVTIYASYNGGDAEVDDNDGDVLELPSAVIPAGFSEGFEVQVRALSQVRDADILTVEPLTHEDWELLEIKADFLESAAFLRQVSLVYAGQIVQLWLGGKDVARIRVLADNFATSTKSNNVNDNNKSPCLRLVQDTRISLVPKPRPKVDPVTPKLRVYPTAEDYSQPMNELAKSLGNPQVYTTPGTAFVNPATKGGIFGPFEVSENAPALVVLWSATFGRNEPPNANSCLLHIAFSSDIPEHFIAVHFLTRARLNLVPFEDTVHLRLLSPIEIVRGSSMLGQKDEGQDGPITLMAVEKHVVRTGKKWRYPTDIFVDATKSFGIPATREECIFSGEPVEDGSFVGSAGQTRNSFHRVVLRSDSCHTSGDNDAAKIQDKCFILREDLPRYVTIDLACGVASGDPESQDSCNDPQLATLPFEVLQSPQLLNLLPENYVLPSSLKGDHGWRSIGGDTLIYGDLGSGKTQTALLMAAIDRLQNDTTTLYVDCKKLKEARGIRMKDILEEINRVFDEASASTVDSSIILDDLDMLAPNLEQGNDGGSAHSHQVNPVAVDQAKLLADTLRRHIVQRPRRMPARRRVSLIITCRDIRFLPQAIVNARPFTCRISTPNLTPLEKETMLWRTTSSWARLSGETGEATFKSRRIGRKCEGYGPQDLMLLASRVKHLLRTGGLEFSATTAAENIETALDVFTPRHKLSLNDEASGAADWDDIGGLFEAKEALASTILSPAKYRRIYAEAKIRLPRGVLLFGCPGCGKSYLVPAMAKKCGFSLITCRGPEILDRYIGASESKVRELFARAAASAPAILFFDEIDSLAPRRGSDKTGVTDRVVNQLLTLLDGVEDIGGAGMVYILAATSRPDIIDPALLRPGRLEKHVYVGYPSSEDETTELFMKISARYSLNEGLHQSIFSGSLVRELKASSPTFDRLSAADLKAAFDTAQLDAIHEILKTDVTNDNVVIGCRHLLKALRSTRPSLPERDHGMLMAAYRPFRNGLLTADSPNVISELRTSLR